MAAGEWRTDREFPITREHVEQWIAKLEAGTPQTTGTLYRPKPETNEQGHVKPAGYCCIGVLGSVLEEAGLMERCEVKSKIHRETIFHGWHFKEDSSPEFGNADPYQAVGFIGRLANWNVPPDDGKKPEKASLTDTLWRMNDHKRYTFPEIAKFLREEILPRIPA